MLADSLDFVRKNKAILLTGFLLTFFSGFGQSVFIGSYIPFIRENFGMGHAEISGLYSLATLCSAFLVMWTGKGLDHIPLRFFILSVMGGLILGCLSLWLAASIPMIFVAFFLLRQCGQGLMMLTAVTSMNRYFEKHRGRAMAVINFGGPAHAIVFPVTGLFISGFIGWHEAWLGYAAFTTLVLTPLFYFLFRYHEKTIHADWKKSFDNPALLNLEIDHWTRKRVLRDWRFFCLMAARIIEPCFMTAIFFYQGVLAQNAGLSPIAFAALFPFLSITAVTSNIIFGFIVDRYGEEAVLLLAPVAFACGIVLIGSSSSMHMTALSLMLMGAGSGMAGVSGGPILAKYYGTKHLGSIKSLDFAFMVTSTAIAPVLIGVLLDGGYTVDVILLGFAAYALIAWSGLAFMFAKNKKSRENKDNDNS